MFKTTSSPSSYHNPATLRRAFGQKSSRRVYARYACDITVAVWAAGAKRRLGRGRLVNIGMGGGLLEFGAELESGVSYVFEILQGAVRMPLIGRVARAHAQPSPGAQRRYGISFILTPAQEKRMKAAIEKRRALESKSPADDSKMKWFWWY